MKIQNESSEEREWKTASFQSENPFSKLAAAVTGLALAIGGINCGKASETDLNGTVRSLSTHVLNSPTSNRNSLTTAPDFARHPLDPLTEREFAALKSILSRETGFSEATVYSWVQLQEPSKADVLSFRDEQHFSRKAVADVLQPELKIAEEVVVDLNNHAILSRKNLGSLQPLVTSWDYGVATKAIDSSAELKAALKKHGCDFGAKRISESLYLDIYAPGHEWNPDSNDKAIGEDGIVKDGRVVRTLRVCFADRQGGTNIYGPYLEGLMALVDVYDGKVVKVLDTGGPKIDVKVPHDFFDPYVRGGPSKPVVSPSTRESIPGLEIEANKVRWGNWEFRYSFNQREGLVLHQIGFGSPGHSRSICYRASISEMLTTYTDPSRGWAWREFFDAGEYGLGTSSSETTPGKEIPAGAIAINAVLPDQSLSSTTNFPNRVFFYERDGGALFAHTQWTDNSKVYARAKDLVVGFITSLGNYDYIMEWSFKQDGSFAFEAGLQGIILGKTVEKDESCNICAKQATGPGTYFATGQQEFGTLVTPQIVGVTHQHWINLRLDFDIDGTNNAVKEVNVLPNSGQRLDIPGGRALAVRTTVFDTERNSERVFNPATSRSWVVYNPNIRSSLGHFPGSKIQPEDNTISCFPESRFGDMTSFTQRHLWVTREHPLEIYAAGRYPNQVPLKSTDNISGYAADNESVYKQDVVLWYTLGKTHVVRPEDYPLMPGAKLRVRFEPDAFFVKSPVMSEASVEIKQ